MRSPLRSSFHLLLLAVAFMVTTAVYWPGLYGGYLFDDYPNIVDNQGVQPKHVDVATLVTAALSSPSSEFKRPLASLSFAANYLATGLNPYWMKLTNLVIHLLNGLLVFLLARALLCSAPVGAVPVHKRGPPSVVRDCSPIDVEFSRTGCAPTGSRIGIVAALIAAGWMLLPINLTGVLYVVQRMESMANLFVLAGLIGYVAGRRRMLGLSSTHTPAEGEPNDPRHRPLTSSRGFLLCLFSITVPTVVGILAKETAVMLPLYACLVEWALFEFRTPRLGLSDIGAPMAWDGGLDQPGSRLHHPETARLKPRPKNTPKPPRDRRIIALFLLVLVLPMVLGLAWLLPGILTPETWATRDFTLGTRLLSEARIVVDYIVWTLLPTPHALSFYHDNFRISTGLLTPWTTLASIVALVALITSTFWLRKRRPLVALGLALFLGCQLLTGTIIPLELIYEHRNYFASFGLMLAVIPLLAAPRVTVGAHPVREMPSRTGCAPINAAVDGLPMALPRYVLLGGLMLVWTALTALTAYAWGNPLRLAEDLAARSPQSPRAEYELGRTYIIYSHYDPTSPFTKLAYAPLEKAAALPDASILPEQALIFMNSRMHLPLKEKWWNSMITKLKARKPGVQDESSLGALTQCDREHHCDLPKQRMVEAYLAALSHPDPNARLLAMYGDYAWNVLDDHALGERMTADAVNTAPNEPAYRITLVRMLAAQGRKAEAHVALQGLQPLDIGGRLDTSLKELRALPGMQ